MKQTIAGSRRRKLKLYLLSFVLFASVFAVVFLVTELIVRYANTSGNAETADHLREADYMPAEMKPNYHGRMWGVPFSTNRFGLRDEDDFPEEPPPGEYRILSLGDSIAFGLGIPAPAHYTKILERNLNRVGGPTRFRVVNGSGPGYSPSCYYLYLKHAGLRMKPRLVILEIELCNDITDEALLRWQGTTDEPIERVRGGRYVIAWDGRLLATCSRGPYFIEKTYAYTVLLRRLLNLLYRINPTEPFNSTPGVTYYSLGFDKYLLNQDRIEAGWTRTFGALAETQRLLRAQGVGFLVLIMPTQYMFDPASGAYGRFAAGLVQRAVGEAEKRGLPYIDFTRTMAESGGKDLYFDFAHPTERGNQVIARTLTERVEPIVRSVSRSSDRSDGSVRAVRSVR